MSEEKVESAEGADSGTSAEIADSGTVTKMIKGNFDEETCYSMWRELNDANDGNLLAVDSTEVLSTRQAITELCKSVALCGLATLVQLCVLVRLDVHLTPPPLLFRTRNPLAPRVPQPGRVREHRDCGARPGAPLRCAVLYAGLASVDYRHFLRRASTVLLSSRRRGGAVNDEGSVL